MVQIYFILHLYVHMMFFHVVSIKASWSQLKSNYYDVLELMMFGHGTSYIL